jgi:hypothetical protein
MVTPFYIWQKWGATPAGEDKAKELVIPPPPGSILQKDVGLVLNGVPVHQ